MGNINYIEIMELMDSQVKDSIDLVNGLTDKLNIRFKHFISQLITFMVIFLLGYGYVVYLPVFIISFLTFIWYKLTKYNRDTAFLSYKSLIVFYETSGILKENNKHILQKHKIKP